MGVRAGPFVRQQRLPSQGEEQKKNSLHSLPSFLSPAHSLPSGCAGQKGPLHWASTSPGLGGLLVCPSQLAAWTFLLLFSLFAHKDCVARDKSY